MQANSAYECPPSSDGEEGSDGEYGVGASARFASSSPWAGGRQGEAGGKVMHDEDGMLDAEREEEREALLSIAAERDKAEAENAALRAVLSEREHQLEKSDSFAARLKTKVKQQAKELAEVARKLDAVSSYTDLCERRIAQLDGRATFPLTERSLADGGAAAAARPAARRAALGDESGALVEQAKLSSANERLQASLFEKTGLSEQLAVELRAAKQRGAAQDATIRAEREKVAVMIDELRTLQEEQRAVRAAAIGRAVAVDGERGAEEHEGSGVIGSVVALRRELAKKVQENDVVNKSWRASVIESEQQRLQIDVLEQELRGRAFDFGAPPEQSEILVELARVKGELQSAAKAEHALRAQLREVRRAPSERRNSRNAHRSPLTAPPPSSLLRRPPPRVARAHRSPSSLLPPNPHPNPNPPPSSARIA